jgi:hypothetical protein
MVGSRFPLLRLTFPRNHKRACGIAARVIARFDVYSGQLLAWVVSLAVEPFTVRDRPINVRDTVTAHEVAVDLEERTLPAAPAGGPLQSHPPPAHLAVRIAASSGKP